MKTLLVLSGIIFIINAACGQTNDFPHQTKVMTLGVFHFSYPNLDIIKTDKNDQISVLEEPYQSEIIAICKAIEEFKPTKIAVECLPKDQLKIDSLFTLYKADSLSLEKGEIYQLGFRVGKKMNLPKIYCIDDMGLHYKKIIEIFNDSIRLAKLGHYYSNSPDSIYGFHKTSEKTSGIIKTLININNPHYVNEDLSGYLLRSFKYEEKAGDFTGVDFQTGRWFNRNLRIFRNIQRIATTPTDRILLIIGAGHLNLLNMLFDVSQEYELVSPLPYLENLKTN